MQSQEIYKVNIIVRLLSELRTSSIRIKDGVCEKCIRLVEIIEYDKEVEKKTI
jgi:hypothetical protein